jgi:hypothetical protein
MEFEVIENSDLVLRVVARAPKRKLASDRQVHIGTTDVVDFLNRENISFKECLEEHVVDNYGNNSKLEAEWVFSRNQIVKKPARTSRKKRTVNEPKKQPKPEPVTQESTPAPTKKTTRRDRRKLTVEEKDKLFGA